MKINMNKNWIISNIECYKSKSGFENVVKKVHYIVEARDEEGNYASTWGNQQLQSSELDSVTFKNFNDLKKEEVISWVQQALEEDSLKALDEYLSRQLEKKTQPQKYIGLPSNW